MNISSTSDWQKENLATLLAATEYIGRCLKDKLENKTLQPFPDETILETSTLAALCRVFHLTKFERDIVLLCTALEIDPSIAQLCSQIQGNPNFNYPTLSLSLATFTQASLSVLSAHNPLQYWRLIEFGTGLSLSQTPLRIEQRILSYLLGERAFDEQLLNFIRPFPNKLEPDSLTSSQSKIVAQVINIWSELSWSSPSIQLCGEEIAVNTIAKAISVALGYNLHIMSATVFVQSPQEIYQLERRWTREALLSNSLLRLLRSMSAGFKAMS